MPAVLLIRHGVNDFVGNRLAGRTPGVHLNETGRKQAERLAEALKLAPLKAIYSSPLERCLETAAPLAAAHNLEVVTHPGLLEIDFGGWTGKTYKQMHRMKLWKTVQNKPSEMTFPGGETFAGAQQRIVGAILEIAGKHEEKDLIACFSHSDAIRLAAAYFLAVPLDEFQRIGVDTGSITTILLGKPDDRPFVACVNQQVLFAWPPPPPEKKRRASKKDAAAEPASD